jgi:cyclophilin family peptidyl-prolyl cis-trans isomerase
MNLVRSARRSVRSVMEPLETRRLLAATVSSTIQPILAHVSNPANDSINLSSFFDDPNITGTVVVFNTSLGQIPVALTDTATPLTVANFLNNYVKTGKYSGTIIHRNVVLSTSAGGSPATPATIVQGGGYVVKPTGLKHIKTAAAVDDEVTTELKKNVAGTIAMAKTSSANSATSEWFFNVIDNPDLDPASQTNGGFTTFGSILGTSGTNVLAKLAALPTTKLNSTLTTVPVLGIGEKNVAKKNLIVRTSNLVYVNQVGIDTNPITFTVTSDNPYLVQPKVVGSTLSFTYGTGARGVADITITAHDIDGTTATQTVAVTVPDPANPTQGPVANDDAPTNVQTGTTTSINVIANDTDGQAALSPSTVALVTQAQHGTALVDALSGLVRYTPTPGYTGPDSFTYTVQDTSSQISNSGTVLFNVVAKSAQATVGSGGLTYTQPDGTVGQLTISGGTAVVTFAGSTVTTTTKNGHITATGTDATISSIVITNAKNQTASLTLTAKGGTSGIVTIGSISDTGSMNAINAPGAALTGNLSVNGLRTLTLASTDKSVITIGSGSSTTSLFITNATDTNVNAASKLDVVKSKQWTNTAGTDESITALSIASLITTGNFSDSLNLAGTGTSLGSANIGGQVTRGFWSLGGNLGSMVAKSTATAWNGIFTQFGIQSINVSGALTGGITASTIQSVHAGGNLSSTITTTRAFGKQNVQLGNVSVGGSISAATIIAAGNIGTISAASLVNSVIYAAVDSTTTGSRALPTASGHFTAVATINSVRLGKGVNAFSNSKIAANHLKSLVLGQIQTNNLGNSEGVAGVEIDAINATLPDGKPLVLGSAQLSSASTLSTFLTDKKIDLGDFAIDILT